MNNLATSALAHGKRAPKAETKTAPKTEPKAKAKGKGKVNEIHVRRAKGGFIASHVQEPGKDFPDPDQAQEPQEHVLPDIEALKAHMQEHMGGGEAQPAQENEDSE